MTKKELFKQLNNLCYEMDCRYNINSGGCCYVAAVIAEQLEKFHIPYKIAYSYCPIHYFIKVSDRYINRNVFSIKNNNGELLNWNSFYLFSLYKSEEWNDTYNKKWNLIVKTRIISLFNKYGNNI